MLGVDLDGFSWRMPHGDQPERTSNRRGRAADWPGTGFRWKSGPSTLTSTLQVVDPPHEIAWKGTTMGIKAVHVFRFQASDGGTLAHSEESWEGLIARLLKGYSRKTLDKGIRSILSHLKAEAERRAATA
jgi:hypothetical protein